MQILIVEDERRLADVLKRALHEAGYNADVSYDAPSAIDKLDIQPYDLVVLDWLLPGHAEGGLAVCRHLRSSGIGTPVLMLTALDSTDHRVTGLDSGADDYLVKPFDINELLARIRALLRRGNKADPVVLRCGGLALDPASKKVNLRGKTIKLTAREYALLEYFMRNQGRVLSQTELLEHVWDYNYDGLSNVVETYVRYLRRKISPNKPGAFIQTMRGLGYVMKEA